MFYPTPIAAIGSVFTACTFLDIDIAIGNPKGPATIQNFGEHSLNGTLTILVTFKVRYGCQQVDNQSPTSISHIQIGKIRQAYLDTQINEFIDSTRNLTIVATKTVNHRNRHKGELTLPRVFKHALVIGAVGLPP